MTKRGRARRRGRLGEEKEGGKKRNAAETPSVGEKKRIGNYP